MLPKNHYDKYDFISRDENFYLNISKENDALIEHSHDFYELVIITNGKGTQKINDVVYKVMPGDLFLLMPDDVHSFVSLDSTISFSWLSCIWLPEFFEIPDVKFRSIKKFSGDYTYDCYNLLYDMHNEFFGKTRDYIDISRLILQIVFKKLDRMSTNESQDYGMIHKKKLVKQAINYINEHFMHGIQLKDISDDLRISQVYLCKLFKIQMGVGAMQYLHKLRIDKSMQLLSTTDMKIEEICKAVGFASIKSMYSLFRKHTGVSPGDFRKHSH